MLDTPGINVGGAGGGAFNAFATGAACAACAGGQTDPGNITSNQNIQINAGSGVIVAAGTIENARFY